MNESYGSLLIYGGIIALGLALFVSPFASSSPDGLDRTAEAHGFSEQAKTLVTAPMAQYKAMSISSAAVSTALAGAIGTLVVFALAWGLSRVIVKNAPVDPDAEHTVAE